MSSFKRKNSFWEKKAPASYSLVGEGRARWKSEINFTKKLPKHLILYFIFKIYKFWDYILRGYFVYEVLKEVVLPSLRPKRKNTIYFLHHPKLCFREDWLPLRLIFPKSSNCQLTDAESTADGTSKHDAALLCRPQVILSLSASFFRDWCSPVKIRRLIESDKGIVKKIADEVPTLLFFFLFWHWPEKNTTWA